VAVEPGTILALDAEGRPHADDGPALAWADAVTNIRDGHAPDDVYNKVREHFTDVETVNLTLVITTINAWNRIAISLGAYPGHSTGHAGAKS